MQVLTFYLRNWITNIPFTYKHIGENNVRTNKKFVGLMTSTNIVMKIERHNRKILKTC